MFYIKNNTLSAMLLTLTIVITPIYASFPDNTPEPVAANKEVIIEAALASQVIVPQPEAPVQNKPNTVLAAFRPADIGATISLAEFHEILSKIKEDLDERIGNLNRVDYAEIINVLEDKKMVITMQLQELEKLAGHINTFEAFYAKKQKSNTLFLSLSTAVGISALGLLAMMMYDVETGLSLPSETVALKNIERIHTKIKTVLGKA